MQIVWKDFINTNQDLCVWCRDEPCETIKVISWGVPTRDIDGSYIFLPSIEKPMVSVNVGITGNGTCTKTSECGAKLDSIAMVFTIEGGAIKSTKGSANFQDNMCTQTARVNTGAMGADLGDEISTVAQGLKIPCN